MDSVAEPQNFKFAIEDCAVNSDLLVQVVNMV
jgi:hypothetical protein